MAIEFKGTNFQSWPGFELTMDDLTVVVGSSNVGKSAIARAFRGLIRNSTNAGQVRVDKISGVCTEGLRLEAVIDGHTVSMERTKKNAVSYTVDGQEYQKLNGAVPPCVQDLGMGELQIGSVTLDPVFASQFGNQFLLQEGSTALNTILGAFSSTEKLEFGKKTANGRIAEKNSEAKLLAKDFQAVEARRVKLEVLAASSTEVQTRIDALEGTITRQEQTVQLLDELIEHTERLERLRTVIAGITVPDTAPIARAIQAVQGLDRLLAARVRHDVLASILSRFTVPDVEPIARLFRTALFAGQAAEAQDRLGKARAANTAIAAMVTTWTAVVAGYKKGQTLDLAVEAIEAAATSRPKRYIKKLDQRTGRIEEGVNEVKRLASGVRQIDVLIAAREILAKTKEELPHVEAELFIADGKVVRVQQEWQEHKQAVAVAEATRRAAEVAKHNAAGHKCPNCGEVMEA